jgi:hypothetical protein
MEHLSAVLFLFIIWYVIILTISSSVDRDIYYIRIIERPR